jgi:CheY-like chemotaxis protein
VIARDRKGKILLLIDADERGFKRTDKRKDKSVCATQTRVSVPYRSGIAIMRLLTRPNQGNIINLSVDLKTHCLLNLQHTLRLPFSPRKRRNVTKSILTISRNAELQHVRTLVLQLAGYPVSAALSFEEAIHFIKTEKSISLVLLCQSVPEASRVFLVARIKELKPTLPILKLYDGYKPTQAKVDGGLHNLDTPGAMLNKVGFMTST